MRTKIESRHTFSIYLPTSLYQKLVNKAGKGKISTFVKEMLEEKLVKEEQQKEEWNQRKQKFRQELRVDYQSVAQSKEIQKEMEIWDETISDMWRSKAKQKKDE